MLAQVTAHLMVPWSSPGVAGRRRIGPFFSLPTLPVAFFADLWPFTVFHRRPLVQGGSARDGEASATHNFFDQCRNPVKKWAFPFGFFKKPMWVVADLVLFRRKDGGNGGAEVLFGHGGLGVRRINFGSGQKWLDPWRW